MCLQVGHHKRLEAFGRCSHAHGVSFHHAQVGAHVRGQVSFVDHEEIALGDAGATLARNFFAGGHVDHVDRQVAELGAKGGRQVVAAGLDKHHVGVREIKQHAVNCLEVDGSVFANGGVWAAACFYAHDALGVQRAAHRQQALVFFGVDVVGDRHQIVFRFHAFAQHLQQGGFARAHRPTYAHAQGG